MYQKLLALFFIVGRVAISFAQGDLLITPTRVVFDGNTQKELVYLVNSGKETATYSVSFLQYDQTEEGGYVIIEKEDSDQLFADSYLRVYPRTITLEPAESQAIAIYFKRNSTMRDGEYRSHLYLRSEVDYTPLGFKNKDTLKTISVKLIPIYGVSIPVIIRKGQLSSNVSLSNLLLETNQDATKTLKLTINRSGESSVNGNLVVDYIDENNISYEVGLLKNVAVYTNLSKRNVSVVLNKDSKVLMQKGKLVVRYMADKSLSKEKGELATSKIEI